LRACRAMGVVRVDLSGLPEAETELDEAVRR